MPSLDALRRARKEALEWLNEHYWIIQATALQDITEIIGELVRKYHTQRSEYLIGNF
jgi:hypothetical protein